MSGTIVHRWALDNVDADDVLDVLAVLDAVATRCGLAKVAEGAYSGTTGQHATMMRLVAKAVAQGLADTAAARGEALSADEDPTLPIAELRDPPTASGHVTGLPHWRGLDVVPPEALGTQVEMVWRMPPPKMGPYIDDAGCDDDYVREVEDRGECHNCSDDWEPLNIWVEATCLADGTLATADEDSAGNIVPSPLDGLRCPCACHRPKEVAA